ncbi:hypothetical protein WA577_003698 [Blastocystis sp. JDR]
MAPTTHHYHKKILKLAKGFRGRQKNCYTIAVRSVIKAQSRAYVGRKLKQRDMRKLWIMRINATARLFGTTYRHVIDNEAKAGILLNRKMLSELAVTEPCSFNSVLCACDVIKKMGIENPEAAKTKKPEVTNHKPIASIDSLVKEMSEVSIWRVF